MRTCLLSIAAVLLSFGIGAQALGQADPNQNPGAALMEQLRQNMDNAGVTPRDLIQQIGQQMQEGTFNVQDFTQQLQDQGIVNQNMMSQFNQMRTQAQGQWQNRTVTRQMTTLQVVLNASDEEWAVLGPRIQRVLDLRNDLDQAANTAQNQQRNVVVANPQQATGPVGLALADLRNVLSDPTAADSALREKLSAYRQARARVNSDLASARADLLNVLTLRQESILLNMLIVE